MKYLLLLLSLVVCSIAEPARAQTGGVDEIPGRIVFKLKPQYKATISGNSIALEKLNAALSAANVTSLTRKFPKAFIPESNPEAVDISLIFQANFDQKQKPANLINMLLRTGLVEYAEPMRSFEPLHQPNDPRADSTLTNRQYYLKSLRAYRGWDFSKGDSTIVIGILDSGVRYTHQDLKKSLKYNYADPINGVDDDNDGYTDNFRGWDIADNDNNATADLIAHGQGVTGVSSATANNGKGIAGVGYNCKFIPVKIYRSLLTGSFAGFEGIVYAADHGCSVINLSWGGAASPSLFEQEVINYAVINRNVVVVAAAGNTNAKLDFYPSSYKNVLSVGGLSSTNVKVSFLTYSHKIDISAYGQTIWTTDIVHDSAYTSNVNGSSQACAMVSGAAGLVRHKFPNYTAEQVAEQLRVTANPALYSLPGNANFQEMLGFGVMDIAKALATTNTKSVRYTDVTVNKGGVLYPGDTLELQATFKNYLNPLTNLAVTLTSASPYVTLLQPNFAAGAMATLSTKSTTQPFKIIVATNTPVNQKVSLRFGFSDGTYTDYQHFEIILNPDYVTIDVNKLTVTVNSFGNIGFNANVEQGEGVRYKKMNLLSHAGLMIGTSAKRVSDNVITTTSLDADFAKITAAHISNSIPNSYLEARGAMEDLYPDTMMAGVKVKYKAYAWKNALQDKFVILEYTVFNKQTANLTNLFAGIFADWDISDAARNVAQWDAANKMGYVYNVPYDTLFAGIKLLTNGAPSYYALDLFSPPAGTIDAIDATNGFSNAEKYASISGGVARTTAGHLAFGNEVGHVVGSALPNLGPSDSTVVAFAVLAGDNLADLQTVAQAAQATYDNVLSAGKNDYAKDNLEVSPNPATGNVTVKLPEPAKSVQMTVVNFVGQTVAVYRKNNQTDLTLDMATLPAGLYILRINTEKRTYTEKLLVTKK